jgi:diguanylate cyclase (GGDEF)-like protein
VNDNRKDQQVTVFSIDLDDFKGINDTYGHQTGDEVLCIVSRILRRVFAENVVARFGGDEFLVLQLGPVDKEEAESLARKFIATLEAAFQQDKRFGSLSASIGITMTKDVKAPIDVIARASDEALYEAKQTGKGCCCVFCGNIYGDIRR